MDFCIYVWIMYTFALLLTSIYTFVWLYVAAVSLCNAILKINELINEYANTFLHHNI